MQIDHEATRYLGLLCGDPTGGGGQVPMEEVFFYHLDHLGTPLAMSRENKSVCWSSEYLPFGQVFNEEGSETNELRFPGQYHDRETDRYYNWHRYYDPKIGRYMQSDPLNMLGGRDWYSYAENNPLAFIDPFGLCRQKNWWEKLEEGCYFGTSYGVEAVDWWARQYNSTNTEIRSEAAKSHFPRQA